MAALRRLGLRGRRTGVAISNPSLLTKDRDGFDDINSFWESTTADAPADRADESQEQAQFDSPPADPLSPPDDGDDMSPSRRLDFVDGRDAGAAVNAASAVNAETPMVGGQSRVPLSETSLGAVTSSEQRTRQQVSWSANEQNDDEEEDETEEEGPGHGGGGGDDDDDENEDDENENDTTQMQPEDNDAISENDEDDSRTHVVTDDQRFDDDASRGRVHAGDVGGGRRSRRTRYPPLAYWKNERFVYERPDNAVGEVLPTVAGVSERSKTPVAPNRLKKRGRKRPAETEPVDDSEIPKDHTIKKGDKGRVWHEKDQTARKMRIICRAETMVDNEHELPITASRGEKENSLVGSAAQAFFTPPMSSGVPGWISGYVVLPPKAIKDAEGVGTCAQVFFVSECQAKGLEVAIALPKERPVNFEAESAQRYLLSPGDQFFVPPNNVYRLENHSTLKACKLFWAIIKPVDDAADSSSDASDS